MLWLEKTASTEASATADISVIVPTISGLTLSSISRRSSCQSCVLKPRVVLSLCLGPQPTWRNCFMAESQCWRDFLTPAFRLGWFFLARHGDHFIQHANGIRRLQAGDEVFAIHDQCRCAGDAITADHLFRARHFAQHGERVVGSRKFCAIHAMRRNEIKYPGFIAQIGLVHIPRLIQRVRSEEHTSELQ